jgi:putative peptide zinc metalloprotease protein
MPFKPSQFESSTLRLRADLVFRPRRADGKLAYLIEHSDLERFFSIGRREHDLACCLNGKRTGRQAYDAYLQNADRQSPEGVAKTQVLTWQQAERFFQFLFAENLFESINSQPIRGRRIADEKAFIQWNPIGVRILLFNADWIAEKWSSTFLFVFHSISMLIGGIFILWATLTASANLERMIHDSQVVTRPENWIWMSLFWIVLKAIHESGHALSCKQLGGKVGSAGVHFLLLFPLPFVDVTSSYRFSSKSQRILVASAGMYLELIVAAACVMIWSLDLNSTANWLTIQVIVMASLSTLIFNLNPLMRFDGYYILTDLIQKPNLATNGRQYQRNWLKEKIFGIQNRQHLRSYDSATKIYGWLATAWRLLIAISLLIAAANLFHGAGIILAGLAVITWYVVPLARFIRNIFSADTQDRPSYRRIAISTTLLVLILWGMSWTPWPFAARAPGIIDFANQQSIRITSDGFLARIYVSDGDAVEKGTPLISLVNKDLQLQLHSLKIDKEIAKLDLRHFQMENRRAERQSELKKLESLNEQIAIISRQLDELTIVAPMAGKVLTADLDGYLGAFIHQGTEVLKIVSESDLQATACVNETDLPSYQSALEQRVFIEAAGGKRFVAILQTVAPTATRQIIHPSLSARNGGPLNVRSTQTNGRISPPETVPIQSELVIPRFLVRTGLVETGSTPVSLRSGTACEIVLCSPSADCLSVLRDRFSRWVHHHWVQNSID